MYGPIHLIEEADRSHNSVQTSGSSISQTDDRIVYDSTIPRSEMITNLLIYQPHIQQTILEQDHVLFS